MKEGSSQQSGRNEGSGGGKRRNEWLERKRKREWGMASERIIKMSLGGQKRQIIFQHKRKRTNWKVVAEFSNAKTQYWWWSFYLPKNEGTGDVLCVEKAQKESDCTFISLFFRVSVISTLEDFVSMLLKSCPCSPLCFAFLPSCHCVCV